MHPCFIGTLPYLFPPPPPTRNEEDNVLNAKLDSFYYGFCHLSLYFLTVQTPEKGKELIRLPKELGYTSMRKALQLCCLLSFCGELCDSSLEFNMPGPLPPGRSTNSLPAAPCIQSGKSVIILRTDGK